MRRSIVASLLVGSFVGRAAHADPAVRILTNHLGYASDGPKHAVIQGSPTDRVAACVLREAATDKEVLALAPKDVGAVRKWRDWRFWTVDFDGVSAEGTYVIECTSSAGTQRSFPFAVQKNILERNTLSTVLYYIKGQRSSGLLDQADRTLSLEGRDGPTRDLHGGWFDATGDYGKHLSHLSFSTYFNPQQIPLTAWSLFTAHARLLARDDPNFRQYKRRLLDEALFGADYLVRARDPRGSFYRSVTGPGPEKRPEDRRIGIDARGMQVKTKTSDSSSAGRVDDSMELPAYEVGYRAGGGLAIAALAMAAASHGTGDFLSADYLAAAEGAFAFLEENNRRFANDGKEDIVDDYCALIAATELFKATERGAYKAAADRRAASLVARLITRGAYKNYWRADDGDRPFFHAADAGLPVVSLFVYVDDADAASRPGILDAARRAMTFELEVTGEVANPFGYARQLVQSKSGARRTAFFFPHDTETAPWWQGENARLASLATAAALAAQHFKSDKSFHDKLLSYATSQLDWILGLNPFDASMLHGAGRNNPPYRFFDSYEYTNAPGGICNGITSGFRDEEDIDFNLTVAETGADNDWRWGEQWLPHASWFLLAVAARE
ncbi:MAG: glycoside hydrolase family 9 protein [Vicinamibacteria bacterium]